MSEAYVGAPWRSRFPRAPKVAFELSSRRDFVQLQSLAVARLGLKTGADEFFYVHRMDPKDIAQAIPPSKRAGVLRVRGLRGAWEGDIAAQDLRPAILNPHELLRDGGRKFRGPVQAPTLYLFPREGPLRADLAEYVRAGQEAGINKRKLVQQNASDRRWYRQDRAMVASRWALPYNSAYEYGAIDNSRGAVLNGRFVGADAIDGVDSELLGLALNTTFVMVSRLLEGTTTGVEGAFDMGPPAVRKMVVPDIRRVSEQAGAALREVIMELRQRDSIPAAPSKNAEVDPLRTQLDHLVLTALGASRSEAAAVVGRVYEGYARWRAAVENVEATMRRFRKDMAHSGRSRGQRPSEIAANRMWERIEQRMRAYPSELLSQLDSMIRVDVPRKFRVPSQEPLFDAGVLLLDDGSHVEVGSYNGARYSGMLVTIGFEPPFDVPTDSSKAGAIVDAFEQDRSQLVSLVKKEATEFASDTTTIRAIAESVIRRWYARSLAEGMQAAAPGGNDD